MSSRGRMPTWSATSTWTGCWRRVLGSGDGGAGAGLSLVDPARLGLTGKGDDAAEWTPTDDALDELFDAIRPWSPPPSEPAPPPDDEPPLPDPEDDSEQPTGHLIPEGKTRAGLIKALEWVWIDVRFNERSARMELQDTVEAAAGQPNWEPSDDLRGAELREMIADSCVYPGAKGSDPAAVRPGAVG